jgi:predicted HNH restriction endonuclease
LEVHHVKPFHLFPQLELDPANLMTLCEDGGNCHFMVGHLKDWRRYNPKARPAAASYLGWFRHRLP